MSSLKLHPRGLNYILVLQRNAGQTAVLQALTIGHMRSNDYSTIKTFVDNFLLLTLSIMSTNRFSLTLGSLFCAFLHLFCVKSYLFRHTLCSRCECINLTCKLKKICVACGVKQALGSILCPDD